MTIMFWTHHCPATACLGPNTAPPQIWTVNGSNVHFNSPPKAAKTRTSPAQLKHIQNITMGGAQAQWG